MFEFPLTKFQFAKRVVYSPVIVGSLQREMEIKNRIHHDKRTVFRQREMEYEDFLRQMEMRIDSRPLLVEESNQAAMVPEDMFEYQEVFEGGEYP